MSDSPMRLEEHVFGDPATFAIWTAYEPGAPRTGYFQLIARGRRIGNERARTTFALQASFFDDALENQLKAWPENLPQVTSQLESLEFLRGVHSGDISVYGYASPFHDCVLTNNLAEPFDGLFAGVRRVTGGKLWLLEEAPSEPNGVRASEVPIEAYERAVREFMKWCAAGH